MVSVQRLILEVCADAHVLFDCWSASSSCFANCLQKLKKLKCSHINIQLFCKNKNHRLYSLWGQHTHSFVSDYMQSTELICTQSMSEARDVRYHEAHFRNNISAQGWEVGLWGQHPTSWLDYFNNLYRFVFPEEMGETSSRCREMLQPCMIWM